MSRVLLWAGLSLCGCASAPPAFEDRRLGTLPADARVDVPVVFSADGRKAAWVERRDGTSRAVSGSWTGRPFGIVC